MAQAELENSAAESGPSQELEGGTYEIIRNRLNGHGQELRSRLDQLNEGRKEVFGSIETTLLGTERITTPHNCVPRDLVAIGTRFLFGYNVFLGLKSETHLTDVFGIYSFDPEERAFHEQPLDWFEDERFQKDFADLFRYYKDAKFAKFFVSGPHVYFVFRVGQNISDIKVFKWVVRGDALVYVDARSEHEFTYPSQHEFSWTRATRDMHHEGKYPHISIDDRVFVETVGGDLTIKIEDNTDSGEGLYSEPVEEPDQTLDDAEIRYAIVGNLVLLRIRPYQESQARYIVYNEKIEQARRLDTIEQACVLLPDDHGLIFADGYYLQNGECKTFETNLSDMVFEKRLASPNGEDFLYIFYNRESGTYVHLRYNLIQQKVDTPVICNGATFFEAGEMVCFRAQEEPQKHHALQIWQTQYTDPDHVPESNTDSLLYKIGNKDIVRGMAECHEILGLIEKEDSYANLYLDLVKAAGDVLDAFFWVSKPETFRIDEPLLEIKNAATAAVDEFDKVVRVKRNTAEQSARVEKQTAEIITDVNHRRFDHINDFVQSLGDLRRIRGDIISLRDLRYIDEALVEKLETEVAEYADKLAHRCVQFLLDPAALNPYQERVSGQADQIEGLTKVTDAKQLEEDIATSAADLEMLIEIVSNLKIDDATHRTTIIDNISAIFATVNTARAALKNKTRDLMSVEGVAEFNSQMKLLNQSVVNYLDICDTPEKCDEFLTKVMIQLEELEGRFAEFDEFVLQLTEKREEIYNAFETRKLQLVEARNKRANSLMKAAERILNGIKTRVDSLESINDINGYFASDLMIDKVRDLVSELTELDDTVKVDDIQSRLKTVREDAVRQLKDRQELFVGGENAIQLGQHRFSVNVQPLDLTTVLRDEAMCLHLTGTNFFEVMQDQELNDSRHVWDQEVISENRDVYRAEYLSYCMFRAVTAGVGDNLEELIPDPAALTEMSVEQIAAEVGRFMGPRYTEAYSKGVHDHDAAKIVHALLSMNNSIGLLRYNTRARALASVFWQQFNEKQQKDLMQAKLTGFGSITEVFPDTDKQAAYVAELAAWIGTFVEQTGIFPAALVEEAAEYLFYEMLDGRGFVISRTAADLYDSFESHLRSTGHEQKVVDSLDSVRKDPVAGFVLARNWVKGFVQGLNGQAAATDVDYIDEVALYLRAGKLDHTTVVDARVQQDLEGLVGGHSVIQKGGYRLNFNRFMQKLNDYQHQVVPRYRRYIERKKELVDEARDDMRLEEFRPRVLTSFVRNKLIDEVYLPLIGDNLAKQIGVVGEGKRTDLMGLLLLVSPPGYGKTTLMEYISNRLGIIFMKINGPAIGHHVTSLDPTEAPNAGAREEVEKLNLALEMGDNVMIYLDDIQHCNPELLQKFISLCDAQRKIEGVYKGQTRTYDLRGRKVVVVMAGNPYTESGEKFQIPDMLSNRADVYNLGEIIGDTADAFEMSYLENCLTSNPVLSKLASRSQQDVYAIIKMASQDSREGIEMEGNYSVEELNELVATMKKLATVRDVILKVNREYIRSAAQADEYRTEPPFKLQGSYRNMNRIAEKVVSIMNDEELETLIVSNYENDSQTLTSDNEANMLKFRELMGILTEEEAERWAHIKRAYTQNVKMKGLDADDQFGQVVLQMSNFSDGLDAIRKAVVEGVDRMGETPDGEVANSPVPTINPQLDQLIEQISGVQQGLDNIGSAVSAGVDEITQSERPAATAAPVAASPVTGTTTTDFSEASQARLDDLIQQVRGIHAGLADIGSALSAGIETITSGIDDEPAGLVEEAPESSSPPPAEPVDPAADDEEAE